MNVEQMLQQAALAKSEEERDHLIREIALCADEILEEIVRILQSPKELLWPVAVRVIDAIGYPDNTPAIPTLIDHASDWNSVAQQTAQEALLHIGVHTMPYLLEAIQGSDTVFDWIDALGTTMDLRGKLGEYLVRELADHPDETLASMLYILEQPMKPWWPLAVRVILAIGYPKNKSAIPLLIQHGGEVSLIEQEAQQVLESLGPTIVVPYFLKALLDDRERERHQRNVSDVCTLLLRMQREYAKRCGPTIVYLISHTNFSPRLGIQFLLRVLEKIGPECASYALPMLVQLLSKKRIRDMREQAQRLINSFDREVLEPYKYVMESLQKEQGEEPTRE